MDDISDRGAALVGRDLPAIGDDMVVVVGAYDALAQVVWRVGDKCGIRFEEPVAAELLPKIKEQASWESMRGLGA